jgi:phage/plasmid-like protein (TIGR03299 family)
MAHELDFLTNGSAAMFSVRQTPWHRLGDVLTDAPDFDSTMNTFFDWDVELHPMTTLVPVNESGDTIEVSVPGNRAVVRMDRKTVLGVVGPSYTVLQNRDAFRVLEPLIDNGMASLETGGVLREGRDVWMMTKWNITSPLVRDILGTEVQPYALIANNHTGDRKVVLKETPVRVVCANTLGFALRDLSKAITVPHRANVKERVVDAAMALFSNVVTRYEAIAQQYAALKATVLTEQMFAALVLDVLAPLPDASKINERKDNIAKAAFERATVRAEERRDRLTYLWANGDGHTGDASAWEAYNAATQSLDHDTTLWGGKVDHLESMFDGSIARDKQAVIDSLVGFATVEV